MGHCAYEYRSKHRQNGRYVELVGEIFHAGGVEIALRIQELASLSGVRRLAPIVLNRFRLLGR